MSEITAVYYVVFGAYDLVVRGIRTLRPCTCSTLWSDLSSTKSLQLVFCSVKSLAFVDIN